MANQFLTGRNCKVTIGVDTIELIGTWEITITADPIEAPVFGDTWSKTAGMGLKKWSGTLTGYLINDSTSVQDTVWAAFQNETILDDIQFYTSADDYWAPDTVADADAGAYITSFSPGAAANAAVTLSISFTGNGPLDYYKV